MSLAESGVLLSTSFHPDLNKHDVFTTALMKAILLTGKES